MPGLFYAHTMAFQGKAVDYSTVAACVSTWTAEEFPRFHLSRNSVTRSVRPTFSVRWPSKAVDYSQLNRSRVREHVDDRRVPAFPISAGTRSFAPSGLRLRGKSQDHVLTHAATARG